MRRRTQQCPHMIVTLLKSTGSEALMMNRHKCQNNFLSYLNWTGYFNINVVVHRRRTEKYFCQLLFTKLTQNDRYDGLLELFFTSGRNFPSTFQCIEKMWRINPIGLCLRTKNRQVLENQDFRMHLTIRFGSNNDDWWYWLDDVIANINSELEKRAGFPATELSCSSGIALQWVMFLFPAQDHRIHNMYVSI